MGDPIDKVLAANLSALIMRKGSKLPSNKAVEGKSRVGQATIDRVRKSQPGLSIAKLEAIATAFGLQAWQLIYPDLDPEAPPQIGSNEVSKEQRWPFPGVDPEEFDLIPGDEKEEVLVLIRSKVTRYRSRADAATASRRRKNV